MKTSSQKFGPTVMTIVTLFLVALVVLHMYWTYRAKQLAKSYGHSVHGRGPVLRVSIGNKEAAEELIPYLRYLPKLHNVHIGAVAISDKQLRAIGRLRRLNELSIGGCELENNDLEFLHSLSGLRHLRLSEPSIDDSGLVHLKALSELEELNLQGSSIDGSGLQHLEALPRLRYLRLGGELISDDTIEGILQLERLGGLSLSSSSISKEGFVKLADLLWLNSIEVPRHFFDAETRDDIPEMRKNKKAFMEEFNRRRREAYDKARTAGEEVPAKYVAPFNPIE